MSESRSPAAVLALTAIFLSTVLGAWIIASRPEPEPRVTVINNTVEKLVVQPVETRTVERQTVEVQQPLVKGADCVLQERDDGSNVFSMMCVRVPQ